MNKFLYLTSLLLLIACNGGGGGGGGGGGTTDTAIGSDPLYEYQWHLKNTGQSSFSLSSGIAGIDINQNNLYSQGVRGNGIKIAVSDSGIEVGHEDLSSNYLSGVSKNFFLASPYNGNPSPDLTTPADMHGTAVTGIIAAVGGNNKGGRGVASSAKFGGFNFLATGITQTLDMALSQMAGAFDIFNYSYGENPYQYQYFASNTERTAIVNAYKTGVTSGRSGKGSVYVKSAGNEFTMDTTDYYSGTWDSTILGNAAFVESNNYPYTILAGAVNADGTSSSYSSPGPNLWVSAPGGEYGTASPAIVTTDFSGCANGSSRTSNAANDFEKGDNSLNSNCNYTSTMNGTSSAAPIVSGVVALMLQANSSLTWRDVKHILATKAVIVDNYTGNYNHPFGSGYDLSGHIYMNGWKKNAANYWFHNYYGFGMVDADASVEMAKNYNVNLGQLKDTLNSNSGAWIYYSGNQNISIPNNSATGAQNSIQVKHNLVVEAVQIKVNVLHDYIENIGIELTSPSGTKSIITNINSNVLDTDLTDAIFLTNAFYGESSLGNWTLKVIDGADINADGTTGTSGTLVDWSINVFGHVDLSRADVTVPSPVTSLNVPAISSSLTSSPAITWVGSVSGDLLRYEYCIGTTSGSCNVYAWTSNGTSTSLNIAGLSLTDGQTYYVSIRAVDTSENTSGVVTSSWQVDVSSFVCSSLHSFNSAGFSNPSGHDYAGKLFKKASSSDFGYVVGADLRRFKVSDSSDTLIKSLNDYNVTSWSVSAADFDPTNSQVYVLIKSGMDRRVQKINLDTAAIDSSIPDFSVAGVTDSTLADKFRYINGKAVLATAYRNVGNTTGYIKTSVFTTSWALSNHSSYAIPAVSSTLYGVSEVNNQPIVISGTTYSGNSTRWSTNGGGIAADDYLDTGNTYGYIPTSVDTQGTKVIVAGRTNSSSGTKAEVRRFDGTSWSTIWEDIENGSTNYPRKVQYSSNGLNNSAWIVVENTGVTSGGRHKIFEIDAVAGTTRREFTFEKSGAYLSSVTDIVPISKDEIYLLATIQETSGGNNFVHIFRCGN